MRLIALNLALPSTCLAGPDLVIDLGHRLALRSSLRMRLALKKIQKAGRYRRLSLGGKDKGQGTRERGEW